MDNQTIYALSTVYGKSGVAIIRVSGSMATKVVTSMTNLQISELKPRYAHFVKLRAISSGELLDKCLLLYFHAPQSFTGEDVIELQVHGSRAVISATMESLSQIKDFRLAEPGEFSKRAFYNGKMDLTQAEGLADLIDAETVEQQKYAVRQMDGALKNMYESWREQLLNMLAHLEAYIDFPEEDIPQDVVLNMKNTVFKLCEEIKKHLTDDNIGERLREGFRITIIGAPNAGKSSLLNQIAKREAVIVSDIAGTTRDAVDIHLDLGGYPVVFTDTAGLRETAEEIEKKGIALAYNRAKEADLVIYLFDASINAAQDIEKYKKDFAGKLLVVANKRDKLSPEDIMSLQKSGCLVISAKQNFGTDELLKAIKEKIGERFTSGSSPVVSRRRYRDALNKTLEFLSAFSFDKEIELTAEDIRLAVREIGKITGRVEVDEVLDKIFGSFCIGK